MDAYFRHLEDLDLATCRDCGERFVCNKKNSYYCAPCRDKPRMNFVDLDLSPDQLDEIGLPLSQEARVPYEALAEYVDPALQALK